MEFKFEEDEIFFRELLKEKYFEKYKTLFDFRPVVIKRKEFNRIRKNIYEKLVNNYGLGCMLNYPICDTGSGFAVDHVLPLATNELNKSLRNVKPGKNKKVKAQSIGSNHLDNLILACNNCNGHKKHKLLNSKKLTEILGKK